MAVTVMVEPVLNTIQEESSLHETIDVIRSDPHRYVGETKFREGGKYKFRRVIGLKNTIVWQRAQIKSNGVRRKLDKFSNPFGFGTYGRCYGIIWESIIPGRLIRTRVFFKNVVSHCVCMTCIMRGQKIRSR